MALNCSGRTMEILNQMYIDQQQLLIGKEKDDVKLTDFRNKLESLIQMMKDTENPRLSSITLCCLYWVLRKKGWRIGCGTKFGATFLLYPVPDGSVESNARVHSKYLVLHDVSIGDNRLDSYIRLCGNIKKTLVLTEFEGLNICDENDVSCLCDVKWLDSLVLNCVKVTRQHC